MLLGHKVSILEGLCCINILCEKFALDIISLCAVSTCKCLTRQSGHSKLLCVLEMGMCLAWDGLITLSFPDQLTQHTSSAAASMLGR